MGIKGSEPRVDFHTINGLGDDPIVFVDFLEVPALVKLVYPNDHEIRYAELNGFKKGEGIAFAKRMRSYQPSQFALGMIRLPRNSFPAVRRFEEFKRQTGI